MNPRPLEPGATCPQAEALTPGRPGEISQTAACLQVTAAPSSRGPGGGHPEAQRPGAGPGARGELADPSRQWVSPAQGLSSRGTLSYVRGCPSAPPAPFAAGFAPCRVTLGSGHGRNAVGTGWSRELGTFGSACDPGRWKV